SGGFSVQFYKDPFGSPSTKCPPELVGFPTPYGGVVYSNEEVLATVAWRLDHVVGEDVACKVWTTEKAIVIHYMLIASGLRHPQMPHVSPPSDLQDVRTFCCRSEVWSQFTAELCLYASLCRKCVTWSTKVEWITRHVFYATRTLR